MFQYIFEFPDGKKYGVDEHTAEVWFYGDRRGNIKYIGRILDWKLQQLLKEFRNDVETFWQKVYEEAQKDQTLPSKNMVIGIYNPEREDFVSPDAQLGKTIQQMGEAIKSQFKNNG